MKRYLLVGICTLLFSACINAPASKSGKDHVISTEQLPRDIITEYTFYEEGKFYPIWLQKGKSGKWRAYVKKVSKRGKEYKYYLHPSTEELMNSIVNDTVNNEEKN